LATQGTFRALKASKAYQAVKDGSDRAGKKKRVEWLRLRAHKSVKLGRLTIEVFPTPHDAAEPVGFSIRQGRLRFSHVTDIGHISPPVEENLRGSQAILLESNHDVEMLRQGPYPDSLKQRVGSRVGHLSNEALARYLEERLPMSVRHLFLAHLSRTNNHQSLALASCREALRRRGEPVPMVHMTFHDRPTNLLRLREPRKVEVSRAQRVLAF
jgi:phosphoribosyl 1,2-cyclic phosphodiesterase